MRRILPFAFSVAGFVVLATSACLLTACGGGGGGGSSGTLINGIAVPPEPDPELNNTTVAGIDSNDNGVRDDVERHLAQQLGVDPARYSKALAHARAEQTAILTLTEEAVSKAISLIGCIRDDDTLAKIDSATQLLLNTPERRSAYVRAFAGTEVSLGEECLP
ncbi:hypothetical protein [Sinimarinibacterium flocculans]|uniref:hypothetical protein n=1 Tax=Sinimarinibacterium flocculans TaxID=985250 RepID=UPI003512A0A6